MLALFPNIAGGGGFPVAQMVKNLPAMPKPRFDLWVGKIPWTRNGNPLQYSCLENPWRDYDRLRSMGSQRVRHD